jgi:hypothetical protein
MMSLPYKYYKEHMAGILDDHSGRADGFKPGAVVVSIIPFNQIWELLQDTQAKLEAAEREVERLKSAIKDNCDHTEGCKLNTYYQATTPPGCICWYGQALTQEDKGDD